MELIRQREKRTIRRKIAKNKFDNMINLSASEDKGIRLLDEGSVVSSDERILFYIKKGTLEKYMSALDDDFVGHINYGHSDFATDPILLGQFTKSDFSLVDIGDGRKSLYVKPHFFDTYRLKDIQAMPFDVGVSVEMNVAENVEDTDKFGFPVIDDVFIFAFAVVGDAGNVNSSGIRLGGSTLNLKEIAEALEKQETIDLTALKEALGEEDTTKEVELAEEGTKEEVEPEAEEETEEVVEASAEESTEENDALKEALEEIRHMSEKITELEGRIESYETTLASEKEENKKLSAELSKKDENEKAFLKALKGINLKVDGSEKKPEKSKSVYMDGIGE